MHKAMLSQPMGGKTQEEIVETRERAIRALQDRGYKVVNTLFTDEWYSKRRCADSAVFPCQVSGKHESLSCRLFL